jgi:hypothetical protein
MKEGRDNKLWKQETRDNKSNMRKKIGKEGGRSESRKKWIQKWLQFCVERLSDVDQTTMLRTEGNETASRPLN